MWIDPDAGLTWEQICEKVWRSLPPNLQQEYQAYMDESGDSFQDICRLARASFQARWEAAQQDPAHPLLRELDFKFFPFGHDPRVMP